MTDDDLGERVATADLGRHFLASVVTLPRIENTVSAVAGESFSVGPIKPLPRVSANADAQIVGVSAERRDGDPDDFIFDVEIAVDLDLHVNISGSKHDYKGDVTIHLELEAFFVEPLTLMVQIPKVSRRDITVDLRQDSGVSRLLKVVGNISEEVRRQIVKIVNRMVQSDEALEKRTIDVEAIVAAQWD